MTTQLESNIISSAKALVNDIRSYAGLTGLPRDVDALIGAHHGLSALVGVVSENGKNSTLRRATAFT